MGENKVYEEFCNKIDKAALKREKISITLETNGVLCSGSYRVEPIMENDGIIEIIAGEMSLVIDFNQGSAVLGYDESCETYIIDAENIRLMFF